MPSHTKKQQDYILTKAATFHPDKAQESVGGIALKRMACHRSGDADNKVKCGTYKVGHCIDCKSTSFKFLVKWEGGAEKEEKQKFAKKCVAIAFANGTSNQISSVARPTKGCLKIP
eukprot:TRINITY_DN19890_c0_g1_i1.p2 TRINITY_DN19890_c0_g1~~TRINITY_DN19890_c0_g1_i1.p2  ORF type:complete len:116 (+),score=20.47 TRINITY_DN19890_c0_g1_i1:880-1227(+)